MVHAAKSWEKYHAETRVFDAVLEHAKAVSASLVGVTVPSPHMGYGEQLFVKLLSHCISLRRLMPDPSRRTPTEFWDVSSLSSLARCAIEAHDAFEYIAGHPASDQERELRLLLWRFHDKTRRSRIAEAIGSTDPRANQIRSDAAQLKSELEGHPLYQTLRTNIQRKVAEGDPPEFHLSKRERCAASKVDFDYYNAITMQLSQHVHSSPYSVHQLFEFKAGSQAALHLMSMPSQFTLPFLSRVTQGISELMPRTTPMPPSRTAQSMELWRRISEKGLKDAA